MAVLEYKCPSCGGWLTFDSKTQKMVCPYCEGVFSVEEVKKFNAALEASGAEPPREQVPSGDAEPSGDTSVADFHDEVNSFSCPSCGGEIITDKSTVSTECPYCGNPAVIAHRVADLLKPDFVLPFKLDKEAAKAALSNHLNGKILLPKEFKDQNRINSLKGIYVPFWLFDCDTYANIKYKATRISHWSDANYDYTKTDHYVLTREGYLGFEKVSTDGSTKMNSNYMESIEPYDYSQLRPFGTEYLSGYMADKYDINADDCRTRAEQRIKASTESIFAGTASGYSSCVPVSSDVRFKHANRYYSLMPVWMLNTKYNDKAYMFAMNGQTGKLVGELPISWGKFWAWFLGLGAGISVLVTVLMMFFR